MYTFHNDLFRNNIKTNLNTNNLDKIYALFLFPLNKLELTIFFLFLRSFHFTLVISDIRMSHYIF